MPGSTFFKEKERRAYEGKKYEVLKKEKRGEE
jgi:hypothetical protein